MLATQSAPQAVGNRLLRGPHARSTTAYRRWSPPRMSGSTARCAAAPSGYARLLRVPDEPTRSQDLMRTPSTPSAGY
jgi:hypothetical protein